jgi:toxin-antitoxin system PIN domain toxin
VIAVDTNLLVYAHRTDGVFHEAARKLIEDLARGTAWAIPWPCVHEFLAIVTHPRIFKTPTPVTKALQQVRTLAEASNVVFLGEGEGYLARLDQLVSSARVQGGAVHDARVAAICLHHGVTELWSADRDFSRYPSLRVRNPLAG